MGANAAPNIFQMAAKRQTSATLVGVLEQSCSQDLPRTLPGSILDRFNLTSTWTLFLLIWATPLKPNPAKSTEFKDAKRNAEQEPNKINRNQARSTKGKPSINLQAPHAETNHETLDPKTEGAAVSRHIYDD